MKPTIKLNKKATDIFNDVIKHLEDYNVLSDIDAQVVTLYAANTERGNYFMQQGQDNNGFFIVEYKNGSNVNGNFNAMQGFYKAADGYAKQLGLSPEYREKVKAFNEKPQVNENPFDKILRKAD